MSKKTNNTENYYQTLGLESDCSRGDIETAYRKLAVKWHPDKNKNSKEFANEKFINISKAYQVLSNEDSRKNYDSHGVVTDGETHLIDPYEMFKDMFNTDDNKIPDAIVNLEADIDKLYKGFTTSVTFTRYSPCKKCDSKGTRNGKLADCIACKGRGILIEKTKGGKVGFVFMEKKCDTCEGKGIDPDAKLCKKCEGKKYTKEELECDVDIPPGAYDRYFIRLENEGNYIPIEDRKADNKDKTRTDVIVVIKEDIPPEIPIRRGMFVQELNRVDRSDLLMTVDITFAESLSGIKKEIPFLANEKIGIEIDDIIQNGDIHVIKGMGMPLVPEELEKQITDRDHMKRTHGDLFLMFKVERPQLSKPQQKRLWQIITDTSYPTYDDIENIHQTVSFRSYIDEQKKFIKNPTTNKCKNDDVSDDSDDTEVIDVKEDNHNKKSDNASLSDSLNDEIENVVTDGESENNNRKKSRKKIVRNYNL